VASPLSTDRKSESAERRRGEESTRRGLEPGGGGVPGSWAFALTDNRARGVCG
jgi:hypothetical protein